MGLDIPMLFRPLFDEETSTYIDLVADDVTKEAALVDPVLEQVERDLEVIRELGLALALVLDTHVHADHVTAAGRLRERCGALTTGGDGGAPCVDRAVAHGDMVRLGSLELHVLATPGHTSESVSHFLGDRVLTGDALLIRAAGRTDFQNGDAGELYDASRASSSAYRTRRSSIPRTTTEAAPSRRSVKRSVSTRGSGDARGRSSSP